ncbi:MAG: hypothetical protein AB1733_11510 [Thermodesulfobacteriota bacterium]
MAASIRYLLAIFVLAIFAITASVGNSVAWEFGASAGNAEAAESVSKVKPTSPDVWKVRPYPGISSGLDALSRYNPVHWGPSCYLPGPAQGQFVLAPRIWFANVSGEARRTLDAVTREPSLVKFDDHLGFRGSGNAIWSIEAIYQFRPRWAVSYQFSPLSISANNVPATSFNFAGRTFTSGMDIHSKWDRWEHRAGISFNLSRTANAMTSLFAEWLYVQDRLTIAETGAAGASASWDDTKSLGLVGLRFEKCLRNYRGNTLGFMAKGGIAFLDDTIGYDAEAGLNYMIPIKTGRFGFVKGGYRYFDLKKDADTKAFGSTLHGAFLSLGFLF